jgi:hypothetical protein
MPKAVHGQRETVAGFLAKNRPDPVSYPVNTADFIFGLWRLGPEADRSLPHGSLAKK